jgi:hypothetical protein
MAVISGSIAALTAASKVLAGTMTKKAVMDGAKKFIKGKTKNAVKNRVTGKGRKKKKGKGGEGGTEEPGAITKVGSSDIIPTSPMFGGLALPDPVEPKVQTVKPVGKVSFTSITNQLDSIVSLTGSIESVTGKGIASKKKRAATARKDREKAKKREKENKREGILAGVGGFLLNQGKKAGEGLGIFNFFTQLFLGFVALSLLKFARPIMSGIEFATKNLHLTFLGFKGLNETFKLLGPKVSKFFKDGLTKLKNFKPNIWGKIGNGIKATFKALGKVLPGFITRGVEKIADISKAIGNAAKAAGRAATFNTRTQQLGRTSGALDRLTNRGGAGAGRNLGIGEGFRRLPGGSGRITNTLSKKTLQIRAQHGDEAARMFQGLLDNGVDPARATRNVNKAISSGKLTSIPMKGSLGGGIKGSQLFKGGANRSLNRGLIKTFGKNKITKGIVNSGGLLATKSGMSRIPIVGPLIVAITTYFEDADGDGKPDKNLDKTLFKTGGTFLGGFLGTFLPIPILGTILGELIGEYVGELFYILLKGGGVSEVGNKLKEDIAAVLQTGQKVLGWAGDGFKRMYEGIPKWTMPDFGALNNIVYGPVNLLLNATMGKGIQDVEIPNPFWMLNPLNVMDKAAMVGKAFFSRDPMIPGNIKKGQGDLTNASGQTGVMSEQAKEISEGKYYLQPGVGYFRTGGDGGFVGNTEEEAISNTSPDSPPASTDESVGGIGDARTETKSTNVGDLIIAGARKIIGLGKGVVDQCANTTRAALKAAGNPNAKKVTQKGDLDTPKGTAYNAPSFAASFGGTDMGKIITQKSKIKKGDMLLWKADVDKGGIVNKGAITHVGIAADDGLKHQYDHNTSKGFHYRPHWDSYGGTSWFAGVRLGESGGMTPSKMGEDDQSSGNDPIEPGDPRTSLSSESPKVDTSIPLNSFKFSSIDKKAGTPYAGISTAADYEKALKKYEARKDTPVKAEVTPTETMTGQDVKPVDPP